MPKFECPTYLLIDGTSYKMYNGKFSFNESYNRTQIKRAKLYLKGLKKIWKMSYKNNEPYEDNLKQYSTDEIIQIGMNDLSLCSSK